MEDAVDPWMRVNEEAEAEGNWANHVVSMEHETSLRIPGQKTTRHLRIGLGASHDRVRTMEVSLSKEHYRHRRLMRNRGALS
jgi:hypothetical protein